MPDVFSVPIFFITFRDTLEVSIIVSVLLALVEQVVHTTNFEASTTIADKKHSDHDSANRNQGSDISQAHHYPPTLVADQKRATALIQKVRWQVFLGSALGLFIALAIGAAFIAVWFILGIDLFRANEDAWKGSFSFIASVLIFGMGLTMLRIDKAKAKWRVKLYRAFHVSEAQDATAASEPRWKKLIPFRRRQAAVQLNTEEKIELETSKWTLFLLPFVTVLREGLEAVVFIGGVSLGQKATAIPLAAIVGLICGLGVGFIIYKSSSRSSVSIFLVISTNLLLLVGAGLFSKAIGCFERMKFNKLVGADVGEAGDGPGSYDVRGNIWHLDCCNPEDHNANGGWSIFAAIFGWSNNGSLGTVLGYIFYWLAAIVALVTMQFVDKRKARQGRTV